MTTKINPFERATMLLVRDMTNEQLAKRVPTIETIDPRRLTYCLIEERIASYNAANIKRSLDEVLIEFSITSRQTYYNWYEKYHSYYQAM